MEVQMFSSSLGAMGSLLGKLRSLLVSPGDQLPEPLKPQDKLELLKQDLEEIHTLLMDLSRVEAPKTMAKLWMNQASDARKRYHRYDLGRWASNPTFRVVNRQVWVPTMDLVGIGDSRANLINLLSNEAEKLMKVISVLGPVGVGKTTLAKEVYRQMRGQFKCRAFVRASKTPDTRRLLRSIISQIQRHQQPPHGLPVQELIDYIRKHLQQKRYFIIIDGLWETISWDIVNGAFPEGIDCSRILITTDFEEVALECSDYQSDCIFKMEPLSRNNSRELFLNRLFGSKHECTEQLKDVSEKIIEKCGGLPLATICIASILVSQSDNSELWLHVNECLSSFIRKNLTSEGMLSEIVGMSYNSLSDHLKTCLLYLSMYPEGYTFLKTDLVKQWMAEGFISAVEGKDTGEVAEFYFDELVCRGLILPNCIGFSDEDIFYTVHSTVFEVIRCKSMEENFATVIDYSEAITKLSAKVRRLSLTFSSAKYATKPDGIALSELRSLTFYGLVNCLPSIMEFKLLRVLILEFWGDKEELDIIGINKLFQLRYLRIRTDMTVKLPASMQELLCLETLEMYARVTTFPSDAFVLPRLLHLCLHDVINVPEGIGHMRSLRTLQCFDLSRISNGIVWSLNEMTNLRDLRLTCTTASREHHLKSNLIALISCLEKLGNLKTMILAPSASCTSINLCCSGIVSSLPISLGRLELLPPICIFSRLPLCMGQLQKLRILKIVLGELTGSDIYSIGRLQELTILSLYVRQPTGELIVVNRAAFPVLKCFKLRCAIMRLAFQADAMPGLQSLKLEFNAHSGEQNGNMLAGIEHLLNLQEVTGRIGAAPGAEESDRVGAESVFKDAISKHSRLISFNLRIVHSVDQEIPQFADTPESCSGSDETLNCSSISDGINEVHEVDTVQELLPFNNASSTDNIVLLPKYQMAPVGEKAATSTTLPQPIPPGYGCQEQPSDGNTAAFSVPFQMTSSDVTTAIAPHHVVGSNTLSECRSSDDGYSWRKYGQKLVKGIREHPRSYYRCTFPNCPTKKRVERSALDGQIIEIVYNGTHNHDKPQNTSRGGSSMAAQPMQSGGSEAFEGKFGGMSGRNDEVGVSSSRAGNSEFDEHEEDFKRLRKDNEGEGISMSGSRTTMVHEPRVALVTRSAIDILDDGFRWRKYGKKMVKENPYPRSYYKCLMAGCSVRKHVERSSRDPSTVITTYKGKHNHGPLYPPPAMANQSSGAGQQQHAHGFGGQGWKGVSGSASGQGTVGGSFVASTPDGVELELTPRALAKEEPKEDALSRCSPSILEHEENQGPPLPSVHETWSFQREIDVQDEVKPAV
ncbi:disease resistance protein RPM1 isoform X2 [Setaria italica]|uniref:disease resistance protein RPM1 isoform X2 n=1 Tax=Setaria italica TaxID=4555 RepID=UPI000BE59F1F|nr:disease resistance protein RPM1 isoform X2 [Setaria italica]